MKKLIATYLVMQLFLHANTFGQMTLPYLQNFETPFTLSAAACLNEQCIAEFLPGWSANEVRNTSRVFRNLENPLEGLASMGLTPTTAFDPEININLGISNWKNIEVSFTATSIKNGSTDKRGSLLYISFSSDAGLTYSEEEIIDTFRNELVVPKINYAKQLNTNTGSSNNLRIKLRATRADIGSGLAAKILIDNFELRETIPTEIDKVTLHNTSIWYDRATSTISCNREFSGLLWNIQGTEKIKVLPTETYTIMEHIPGIYILNTENGMTFKFMIN